MLHASEVRTSIAEESVRLYSAPSPRHLILAPPRHILGEIIRAIKKCVSEPYISKILIKNNFTIQYVLIMSCQLIHKISCGVGGGGGERWMEVVLVVVGGGGEGGLD